MLYCKLLLSSIHKHISSVNMSLILLIKVCILALAPLANYNVKALTVSRLRSDLVLYGGFHNEHQKVIYSGSDMSKWKNLEDVAADGGLAQMSLLCAVGNGAWIAYPQKDYAYDGKTGFVLLLIGDVCISTDQVNSVQPVGPIHKEFEGIITFKEAYFGSQEDRMSLNDTASGVKSLIYPADAEQQAWTVEGDGKKYCVYKPKGIVSAGLCIIPDFSAQLSITEGSMTPGCNDKMAPESLVSQISFQLQTCYSQHGVYRILDNYLQLPEISQVCKDGADEAYKTGFYKIVDIWKFRMSPDRQEEVNPAKIEATPDDEKSSVHKTKLLTMFFEIFEAGCPSVPPLYFNIIRYIFMQHLKSIWTEVPTIVDNVEDNHELWYTSFTFLSECYEHISALRVTTPETSCANTHPSEGTKPDWESDALDLMLEGNHLDQVIEQVWLILNYVSPYCSSVHGFKDNSWTDFVNLFRRKFLAPVVQQWVFPGNWQTYYEFMFNGYPLERGKRQIITCIQDILRTTPDFDPVDRPSATLKGFTNLSKKKPAVPTSVEEKSV